MRNLLLFSGGSEVFHSSYFIIIAAGISIGSATAGIVITSLAFTLLYKWRLKKILRARDVNAQQHENQPQYEEITTTGEAYLFHTNDAYRK